MVQQKSTIDMINKIFTIILIVIPTLLVVFGGIQFYRWINPEGSVKKEPIIGPQVRPTSFLTKILNFFKTIGIKVFDFFKIIFNYIKFDTFKFLIMLLIVGYLIISYTFWTSKNFSLNNYLYIIKPIWITLGFSLILSLFVTNIENWNTKYPGPTEAWSVDSQLRWTWARDLFLLKIMISICLVFLLFGLLVYFIGKNKFLQLGLTSFIQVIMSLAILFGAWNYIKSNPTLRNLIDNNIFFKILYHFIFLIPCGSVDLVNYLSQEFKNTPQIVYFVFLIQLVLITLYFIFPIIEKYLYSNNFNLSNEKDKKLDINTEKVGIEKTLINIQNSVNNIRAELKVNWKKIISERLDQPDKAAALEKYLRDSKFKDALTSTHAGFITWITSRSKTLEQATSYIKANTQVLVNKQAQIDELVENINTLNKAGDLFESKIVQNNPVYTDKLTVLGNFQDLKSKYQESNYRYGVSAWVFLFNNANKEGFTSVLNYGQQPNILFNSVTNVLRFQYIDNNNIKKIIFETDQIPLQRWNNLVINYVGGTLDIFLNKKLVASEKNILPRMKHEAITIGKKNGINGSVCNVVYFSSPLNKTQIDINYDSLKDKNPPTI